MPRCYRRTYGGRWFPLLFRPLVAARAALLFLSFVPVTHAFAAEYRDSAAVFTIAYDDAIWTIKPGDDGEFAVACARGACDGAVVGCSGSRLWVPLASVGRLTREFDSSATERTVLDGLARERAANARASAVPGAEDVAPEVVKPYTLTYSRDGHPIYESDFRASVGPGVTRFLSFSTAARSHSIALVCHVPESRLPVWRPRIDALIEGFKPAPDPFWLRWLAYIGL
jgi:hypothetical protein